MSPDVADDVYRVAREAIANAVRHTRADRIDIEVAYEERRFSLRIEDNGVGISQTLGDKEPDRGHFGISGMRERAAAIGAAFSIANAKTGGTIIKLSVPATRAHRR